MAENPASASPNKVPAGGGDGTIAPANSNPNLPSPQIPPSPSMAVGDLSQISSPQLSQSHALSPAAALDYASKQQSVQSQQQQPLPSSQQLQSQPQMQGQQQQQKQQAQQQQNMMSPSSYQMQQNLQRSGSMTRLSQLQQQLGASAAAGAMRQHAGMYGGQVNFGGAQIQQQQQQMAAAAAAAAGGMGRSGIITQAAQLPMLPTQTTQHFNLQSQMLTQPRQKGLVQAGQFNPGNSSAQALQGMQNMGIISNLSMNPQLRAYNQRLVQGQIRQQQLQQQMTLTSPQKLPGQSLPRAPSAAALNSQVSGLTQNGQSTIVQTTLSQQQQWLKHLQPSLPSPVSPSYHLQQQQRQQQSFLPQQLASSQLHQKSMALTPQQISQLMQQQPQPQLGGQQQQQHLLQMQQLQQIQQLQQQQQLQSPKLSGSAVQKPLSLTGSQEEAPASGMTGGSSSQGTEATNQLLGKRKIHDLVMQVDPHGKLDPEVEDLLLQIADDFIDSVTTFACSLAKHRKSSTLDTKDVLLHLEKNWNLTVPGYSREDRKYLKTPIQESAETHQLEGDAGGSKATNKQLVNNSGSDHPINPSPSSEQLSLPVVASQTTHKPQRF